MALHKLSTSLCNDRQMKQTIIVIVVVVVVVVADIVVVINSFDQPTFEVEQKDRKSLVSSSSVGCLKARFIDLCAQPTRTVIEDNQGVPMGHSVLGYWILGNFYRGD